MKIVQTYVGTKELAEKIAETLLEEKLAACIGFWEGQSRYWWEGKIERTKEYFVMAKTRDDLADQVVSKISEVHAYDLPAIDVFDVEKVSPGIEEWLRNVTKS